MVTIYLPPSFETSWQSGTTTMSLQVYLRSATAVANPLVCSMVWTAKKVAFFLVTKGHNELRDFEATLANAAWGGVVIEPVIVPENIQQQRPSLKADWMARDVWEGSRVAFFDNRIVDADAPSYSAAHLSCRKPSARGQPWRRGNISQLSKSSELPSHL